MQALNRLWYGQLGNLHGWTTNYPNRPNYWYGWGNNVRHQWNGYPYHQVWFVGDWWYQHPTGIAPWHYYQRFNDYPWQYWWSYPSWNTTTRWFTWSAPPNAWAQPIYYDYGPGGNVVYRDNRVFINDQPVATAAEFAESAAVLATVPPPESVAAAQAAEWLPLGTFAMSTSEEDLEPTEVLQLAVTRQGIVGGTLYDRETNTSQAIQGQVDKETQRVAFRLSETEDVVAETGLFNLTQDSAPLLVHFGQDRVETYNLVRLTVPEEEDLPAPAP